MILQEKHYFDGEIFWQDIERDDSIKTLDFLNSLGASVGTEYRNIMPHDILGLDIMYAVIVESSPNTKHAEWKD